MTKRVKKEDIEEIIQAINNEKVVSFPTETVFGLGVKFNSKKALDKLMEAKNRDYSKAITLMVRYVEDIENFAYVSHEAKKIMNTFMPGMLTIVLKKKEIVDDVMTNGKDTIGIRIPDHEYVLSLLENVGPMLVTSANLSNHPNTTTVEEVLNQLDGRIDYVVEGETSDNIASTVIDMSGCDIKILREGKITRKDIEEVLK
ncbi:MAG: threonylcarbamoyl-AMP synthase [Erysipelotrichales bacterium]|nr:threonylcarbamoyl-AMP synthase [Erysipelotrichales bacterium]